MKRKRIKPRPKKVGSSKEKKPRKTPLEKKFQEPKKQDISQLLPPCQDQEIRLLVSEKVYEQFRILHPKFER